MKNDKRLKLKMQISTEFDYKQGQCYTRQFTGFFKIKKSYILK